MVRHPTPQPGLSIKTDLSWRVYAETVFLVLAGILILFRITIWRFFPPCEIFVKEDLSNLLVAGVVLLVVSAWLVLKTIRRESLRSSGFEIPILLFVGAAFGSLFYSVDFSSSLTGVLVLFAQVAFFYMLQELLGERERLARFLYFLIACAVLVGVFGIKDFIFLSQRPSLPTDIEIAKTNESLYYLLVNRRVTSFLGWPNTLAAFLMLFMPLVAAFIVTAKQLWSRAFFLTAFLVLAVCFVFTFSFLGWLSFLVATGILVLSSRKLWKVREWPRGQKAVALCSVVVFLLFFGWVIARKNFAAAMVPRVEYYKRAIELVKARPFLGHGWETFGTASRKFITNHTGVTAYVHNSYLQAWVETGIIGLLGILLLPLVFVRRSFLALCDPITGDVRFVLWAVVWGLGAFFIDNLFSFTLLKPNIALHFWVMLAVFVAISRRKESERERVIKGPWLPVVGLIVIFVVLGFIARMIIAFGHYQAGMAAFKRGNMEKAERLLYRAQVWDPWRSQFRAGLGQIYLAPYFNTGREEYFVRAEAQYWQAVRLSPSYYGNYLILSKLYERHGDKTRAEQLARVAKALSPYQYEHDLQVLAEMARRKNLTSGGGP